MQFGAAGQAFRDIIPASDPGRSPISESKAAEPRPSESFCCVLQDSYDSFRIHIGDDVHHHGPRNYSFIGQLRKCVFQGPLLATCHMGGISVLATRSELVGVLGASERFVQRNGLFGIYRLCKLVISICGRADQ